MTIENYEFIIIDPPTYLKAQQAAKQGFKDAQLSLALIERTISAMAKNPIECVCLDCKTLMDDKSRVPRAFAVCIPMFPKAGSEAVSAAICESCVDRLDLKDRMFEALRKLCPSATLVEATGAIQ